MAEVNKPGYEFDQDIGTGGINHGSSMFSTQPQVIYFKDIVPTYTSDHLKENTNSLNLSLLMGIWGFASISSSGVTAWKIVENSMGPYLYWKGSLFVKWPGAHLLKFKNRDKTGNNYCWDFRESGYICLDTHASVSSGWYYVPITEIGLGIEAISTYVDNNVKLPYYKESTATPKYYVDTDSSWSTQNRNNSFGPVYSHDIPNFFINGKMFNASVWRKYSTKDSGFRFNKELNYTYEKKKDAKQFYMQEYCYLLFNNFNTTFAKGSTATNEFTITQSDKSISISYKTHSKTITKTPGDKVFLFIRFPATIKSTAEYKWHYYCYANRDWNVSWKKDFDVYYENGVIPENEPNHSFGGNAPINILEVPNGTHVFKGETIPVLSSWSYVVDDNIWTSFTKTKTYKKEEKISSSSLDKHIFNGAFLSSGPGISYYAQNPYSSDIGPGGRYLYYTEEQTKHVFNLTYGTFVWDDEPTFSWNKDAQTWFSWASWSGDDNHFWLASYMVWRCVVNEIGLVSWGYAKEKTTFFQYDTIGSENGKVNPYATPTGHFKYHGTDFYCIDTEMQSEYTEASYSQGEKPNVRGAFTHGLLVNTSNTNHVNSSDITYGAKSGYTNEPAIAVVLMSKNPDITGLSSFNRRY